MSEKGKEHSDVSVIFNQQFLERLDEFYNSLSVGSVISKKPTKEMIDKCIDSGTPIIYNYMPFIDIKLFKNIYEEIKKLVLDCHFENRKFFEEFEEYFLGSDEKLYSLIQSTLLNGTEGMFSDTKFNEPFFAATIMAFCLKPFLKTYSSFVDNEFDLNRWNKGYCPICGHDAAMAFLYRKNEGKRCLWCPLCEFEWLFKRICCPSCYEENPNLLGYFRVEEKEDGYRVNVCYTCKRYIKTYDEQNRQKRLINKFLEEKLTADLDYLAQKEGFTPTPEKN